MAVAALAIDQDISDEELQELSAEYEADAPEAVLHWALEGFERDVALATGFGAEGCVLVHMLAGISREVRIFYLNTDLLFPETYALRDQLAARYGVQFERRATSLSVSEQAAQYGERLWAREPDLCCRLRKVEPLGEMLKGMRAWVTAIRRDQSPARARISF